MTERDPHPLLRENCQLHPLLRENRQLRAEIERLRAEIERLRALIEDACQVFVHYDLPEHAFHYRRALEGK